MRLHTPAGDFGVYHAPKATIVNSSEEEELHLGTHRDMNDRWKPFRRSLYRRKAISHAHSFAEKTHLKSLINGGDAIDRG